MKKIIICLSVIILLQSLNFSGFAESFSWYCVREKNHRTPSLPSEFSFVAECSGYSVDSRYCEYTETEKVIYLTFDAGYENGNIEKILDILKEEEVTASFFVLAYLIGKNTELVKRMTDEGHLVCNHTFSHKNMSLLSEEEFTNELSNLERYYNDKTGKELSKFYRPPEGVFTKDNLVWAQNLGYKTVFWSFAYMDWDNSNQPKEEYALRKIKENLHNGEIMLLHPTSATNANILKEVIRHIKSEGFRFASLEELV